MRQGCWHARARAAAVLVLSLTLVLIARPGVGQATALAYSVPTSMASSSVTADPDTALVVTPTVSLGVRGAIGLPLLDGILTPSAAESSPPAGASAGQVAIRRPAFGGMAAPTGRSPPATD
jgi:hypothetical protein